jgi:hypothetical protein
MVHVMRVALFLAPVANVGAQFANLFGERTIARDRVGTQTAHRRTLDAASRAVIFAFYPDHVREAVAALGRTEVAGFDTVFGELVQTMVHDL